MLHIIGYSSKYFIPRKILGKKKKAESKENKGLHNLGGKDQHRIAFKLKNYIKIQSELGLAFTSTCFY